MSVTKSPRRKIIVSQLKETPRPLLGWPSAIVRGCVVAGCFVVGIVLGQPEVGGLALLGAFNVGSVITPMSRGTTARVGFSIAAACAVMGFVAMSLADTAWLLLAIPMAGFLVALAARATVTLVNVTLNLTISLIVLSETVSTPLVAALGALAIFAGGCVQVVAMVLIWRADTHAMLIQSIQQAFDQIEKQVQRRDDHAAQALSALAKIRELRDQLQAADLPADVTAGLRLVIQQLDWVRRQIAEWGNKLSPAQRTDLTIQLQGIAKSLTARSTPCLPPGSTWPAQRPGSLQGAVQLLGQTVVGTNRESNAVNAHNAPPHVVGRAWLKPGSWLFATLYASALLLSYVAAKTIGWEHAYWAPLATSLVIKPDTATSLARGVLRTCGDLLGVAAFGVLLVLVGDPLSLAVPLALLCAVMVFRFLTGNYAISCFFVAGMVLTVGESVGRQPSLPSDRFLNTALGCAIGIAAVALWPRSTRRVPATLARVLPAQQVWSVSVLEAWRANDRSLIDTTARAQAADNLLRLRTVVSDTVLGPHRWHYPVGALAVITNDLATLNSETIVLEGLVGAPGATAHPRTQSYQAALRSALLAAENNLDYPTGHHEANPPPPPETAGHPDPADPQEQQLKVAAEMVAAAQSLANEIGRVAARGTKSRR